MRKTLFTLLSLMWVILLQAQTTLPNGDFEQWNGNKPDQWDASNYQILTLTIKTVFQDTVLPMSGSSSVRLKSNTFNLITVQPTIPGIITLGTIVVNTSTFSGHVEGGIPFNGRPLSLKGYIHPMPAAGDSTMIALGFSKWNGTGRDTIGEGIGWFGTPKTEWEAFDIPITFTTLNQPDSMNIIISSSAIGNEIVVAGSEVKIDDLSLDYGNVIVKLPAHNDGFSMWADEGRNLFYSINGAGITPVRLEIYNMNGALVSSTNLPRQVNQGSITVNSLTPGVYVIGLVTSEQKTLTRKFLLK